MLRTFTVTENTDLQSLRGTLLDGRFRGAHAEAAVAQLRAFNPHADLDRLSPGTVLFVPDTAGFKAAAGTSVQSARLDDFRTLVAEGLRQAAVTMRSAAAARAADRAEVIAALDSDAFRRLVATDNDLAAQGDAARASIDDEQNDSQAIETVATINRGALAALTEIARLFG